MAIPYMGSKAAFCSKIFNVINNFEPNSEKILVDLFCGGFSVSEYFLKQGWTVISNDLNKYNIALIKKICFEGIGNIGDEFITRDKFKDVQKNPENYDDWYVGYVLSVWSFGNKQTSYLFSKENEKLKHKAHRLICNDDKLAMSEFLSKKDIDYILSFENKGQRRIALSRIAKSKLKLNRFELQRLERLQQLELYCGDYKKVDIPANAIVYCDPPYESTSKYLVEKENKFNINEFWNYAREISKTNKIYISSYKCPDDFISVYSFSDTKKLAQKKSTVSKECLFVPKHQLETHLKNRK